MQWPKQLLRPTKNVDLAEIHQYTQDIERMTALREKADRNGLPDQVAQYDNLIHVMVEVSTVLNEILRGKS